MSEFDKEELDAAKEAFLSWVRKIAKVRETLSKKNPPPKPQLTLAAKNLNALDIAIKLIDYELTKK